MKLFTALTILAFSALSNVVESRPQVWIVSDLSRPDGGTDRDDIPAVTVALLMANQIDIKGLTVGADPKIYNCQDSINYANQIYNDYRGRLAGTNGYPSGINFKLAASCRKNFDQVRNTNVYGAAADLSKKISRKSGMYVLNWGPMTEIAWVVNDAIRNGKGLIKNVKVVSHWTRDQTNNWTWNCNARDYSACNFMRQQASQGRIKFWELGPNGQYGMVDNSCNNGARLDKSRFAGKRLGRFLLQKWWGDFGSDFSDCATIFILLGWGEGLGNFQSNGNLSNQGTHNNRLCQQRARIRDALYLAQSRAA